MWNNVDQIYILLLSMYNVHYTLNVENPCNNSKEFHADGLHELYKNIDFSSILALVDVDVTGSPGHL